MRPPIGGRADFNVADECRPHIADENSMTQTVLGQGWKRPPEGEPSQIELATTYLPDAVRWLFIAGFGGLAAYATYDGLHQLIAANAPDGKVDSGTDLPIKFFSAL